MNTEYEVGYRDGFAKGWEVGYRTALELKAKAPTQVAKESVTHKDEPYTYTEVEE